MNQRIHLSSQNIENNWGKYVEEATASNTSFDNNRNVTAFEKSLESYLGENSKVAAVSSGTAGIHLGLILLGVQKGDTVLCQSFTFSASANPIIYIGAKPIFIDSEKDTWNICPAHLEDAIKDCIHKNKKPKAIIAVHLFGMPYNIKAIDDISKKYEIPILEDSAEALGSSYKEKKCGTFGDISVLSFNTNKIITISGGGALVSKKRGVVIKARFLATQAKDEAIHYQHSQIGYNYKMSNILAGVGRGQMKVLAEHIGLRRKMNYFYSDLFSDIQGIKLLAEPNNDYFSNHWLTCATFEEHKLGYDREKLRLAMEAENIECRPLWKPMHMQPIFENAPFYGSGVSERLFETGLCLPSGSNLTDEDRSRIAAVIKKMN